MPSICALVVAAGRGTRARLPYPKTLFSIQGLPILIRIAQLLYPYDEKPTIIVSPDGKDQIAQCLRDHGMTAELVVQCEARGMGDAVLRFQMSPAYVSAEHVLLIWGDMPFVQANTVEALVSAHLQKQNDFTLATRRVEQAYTVVSRNEQGMVTGILETREAGMLLPPSGERDIGVFVFHKQPVFDALQDALPEKFGKTTGEHGFLYVVAHLVKQGFRVEALPIATELDLVSLNSLKDVHDYL